MKLILGKKIGMTQIFEETGEVIPVTVIQAGPAVVTQIKTEETDGYNAVQVGFEDQKPQRVNKPMTGHFAKSGADPKKYLAEFKNDEGETYELGQVITVADFQEGMKLDITGVSKGKGTQGAIKRWGQHRGPMKHGSKYHRHAGSNGPSSDPSRVVPGKHMAGRMGREQVTVQNLVVVRVDAEKNLILVKGAVPGPKKSLVTLKETTRTDLK